MKLRLVHRPGDKWPYDVERRLWFGLWVLVDCFKTIEESTAYIEQLAKGRLLKSPLKSLGTVLIESK